MITLGTQRHVALADGAEGGFVECLSRLAAGPDTVKGAIWIDDESGSRLYEVAGPVAVIGVRGGLFDYLPFHGAEWATGYNCIRLAVDAARRDPAISVIALAINSPGGLVSGCFELVEWLRDVAGEIPLFAVVDGLCASAAYAIASACTAGWIKAALYPPEFLSPAASLGDVHLNAVLRAATSEPLEKLSPSEVG